MEGGRNRWRCEGRGRNGRETTTTTCSSLLFPRVFVDDQGIRGAGDNDILRHYPPAFLTPMVGWDSAYAPPPSYPAFVPVVLATGDGMKPICHPLYCRLPPFIGGILSFFLFVSALYPPPLRWGGLFLLSTLFTPLIWGVILYPQRRPV